MNDKQINHFEEELDGLYKEIERKRGKLDRKFNADLLTEEAYDERMEVLQAEWRSLQKVTHIWQEAKRG